jgi:ribosome-associated protein
VNTTDSRVELSVDVKAFAAELPESLGLRILERLGPRLVDGVLTVDASEHRSQLRNREAARARLDELLRQAAQPPPPRRKPTRPSAGARRRRLENKARRSTLKRLRGRPDE